jgi:hypothetical protein
MDKACGTYEENVCKILVRKPEGTRPLEKFSVDGCVLFKINVRETEWEFVDWIHLAQVRDLRRVLVNTVMKRLVSYKAENVLTS